MMRALVARLFTINDRVDFDQAVLPLVPSLDADRHAMRNLAVEQTQHFFAHDFGRKLALRLVGHHILRKQLRPLDRVSADLGQQLVQPLPRARRDRDDRLKVMRLRVNGDYREKLFLFQRIDLVNRQNSRHTVLLELCDQALLGRTNVGDRLDHQHRRVHLGYGVGHNLTHVVAQTAARPVQTGRVQKNILRAVSVEYAGDAGARGLRLARGHNGQFLPHQLIGQGGFPYIRAADHGNDRRFGNLIHCILPY